MLIPKRSRYLWIRVEGDGTVQLKGLNVMRFKFAAIAVATAGAALIVSGGYLGAADSTPAEIIKARQEHLKDMGASMKAIVDQVKTGGLDKTVMTDAAKKIAAYSRELPKWFPKGSGEEAGVKTAAKPEIWAQSADFQAAADKLPPEADKLIEIAATGDAAAIGAQLQATGRACGGCHKPFRVPPPEH
jgi:cytochrome c556